MGVYIPNIEMPKSCDDCPHPTCKLWQSVNGGERNEKCPIVPVPPHCRLIDADAVERNLVKMQMAQKGAVGHGIRKSRAVVRDMPTVIEGEE